MGWWIGSMVGVFWNRKSKDFGFCEVKIEDACLKSNTQAKQALSERSWIDGCYFSDCSHKKPEDTAITMAASKFVVVETQMLEFEFLHTEGMQSNNPRLCC
jgi:putative ribosome biogenesis GTPase RsgA